MKAPRLLIILLLPVLLAVHGPVAAQETGSALSGRVLSDSGSAIAGVTITLVHLPTRDQYRTATRADGYFHFFHLRPGGPYTLQASHTGYAPVLRENIRLDLARDQSSFGLGDNALVLVLRPQTLGLDTVRIVAPAGRHAAPPGETSISRDMLDKMPSINRNLQDYVRLVPGAKVTGDGIISLAGQNNRFNAFFIDGVNNTDIQGLSVNGANGGQTGAAPISIEALDEMTVMLSPNDVQYSNFTGGSIHAVTRSGSNRFRSAAWYFFRNEDMAGKSPVPLDNPAIPGTTYRPRLPDFFNQNFGAWASGPIRQNKLFYFFLFERQKDTRPVIFDVSQYQGNSSQAEIDALADTVRARYGYDPGDYLSQYDRLDVKRLSLKLDWTPTERSKFMFSWRLNEATKSGPRVQSSNTQVAFANSGIVLPSTTHGLSFEWKQYLPAGGSNRLLAGYTRVVEDRQWMGQPFPRVQMTDGRGNIILGSDGPAGLSLYSAHQATVSDLFTFVRGKQVFKAGADLQWTLQDDNFVPAYFGIYRYDAVSDFLENRYGSRYTHSFSTLDQPDGDQTSAGSRFTSLRGGLFFSDEVRLGKYLLLTAGLRVDRIRLPRKPPVDSFFNDTAQYAVMQYHDLQGAVSGAVMDPFWQVSPRIGFSFRVPGTTLTLQGGTGLFAGQAVSLWIANLYNQGIGSIDINPRPYGLLFNPDPYGQPDYEALGINPGKSKGELNLVSKQFRYPVVLRSSLSLHVPMGDHWNINLEGLWTVNQRETVFRNINILPPIGQSAAPGSRDVYSVGTNPRLIPMGADGSNPYSAITLMANNQGRKGYAGNLAFTVSRQRPDLQLQASYAYGFSRLYFEVTGANTSMVSQWQSLETVDGRNKPGLTISDNDLGHRIFAMVSKTFRWHGGTMATLLSLVYNGQSGTPYSYVHEQSMVNDIRRDRNVDLAYIPTVQDLEAMSFQAIQNGPGPSEQKAALNQFIESDPYLRAHRGSFAARNGARLPFFHTLDLRAQQDFLVKFKPRVVRCSLVFDIFNLLNLINHEWGWQYFTSSDQVTLMRFAGYNNVTNLVPDYQYKPYTGKPYTVQGSTQPGNSARWQAQLGFRLSLD